MIPQAIGLLLVSFAIYLISIFLRDLLSNFGFVNEVSNFVVPLVSSMIFFIICTLHGLSYALFALLPLILFLDGGGISIISALFVSYLHPALAILLLPPVVYGFSKAKHKYSYIKLNLISYLLVPVALFGIFTGYYFLTLLPISIVALLIISTFTVSFHLLDKSFDLKNLVLISLTLILPFLSLFSGETYNSTLISIGIIFSLVPIIRHPFWVRG